MLDPRLAAEGLYKTGAALDRPGWGTLAGDFTDRLVAYGHPEGYFEEHTNDAREGGPSLVYTPLTAGCAYLVQQWRDRVDRERFARCGTLYRSLVDARFHALAFADERANPHGLGSYGIALHALTPEGRGFLRMALDPDQGSVRVWFIAPFNPYSAGNRSHPSSRRPLFVVEWTGRVEFRFRAK